MLCWYAVVNVLWSKFQNLIKYLFHGCMVVFFNEVPGQVIQIQTAILVFVEDFHLQEKADLLLSAKIISVLLHSLVISSNHLWLYNQHILTESINQSLPKIKSIRQTQTPRFCNTSVKLHEQQCFYRVPAGAGLSNSTKTNSSAQLDNRIESISLKGSYASHVSSCHVSYFLLEKNLN